jgi:hypothetical protein
MNKEEGSLIQLLIVRAVNNPTATLGEKSLEPFKSSKWKLSWQQVIYRRRGFRQILIDKTGFDRNRAVLTAKK